jgi:carbamoyltransferase
MFNIGVSCGFHDAAVSVVDPMGNIVFAGHSERYSKTKHDANLCVPLIQDALSYVTGKTKVNYYEKPWLKLVRQLRAGQSFTPISIPNIFGLPAYIELGEPKVHTHGHHLSHAAAGFQTSPFQDATIVVIDAIGELDTISVWDARYDKNGKAQYKKLWGKKYPNSIGLFYSAMTKRVGLKPLDEEYILMGMAAYGDSEKYYHDLKEFVDTELNFADNLHTGFPENFLVDANDMDLAAATQKLTEQLITTVLIKARMIGKSKNLVYGGGVALNCVANSLLGNFFDNFWIMPNPGDAGSSLGAAALGYGKQMNWQTAFLGHEIPGRYPIEEIITELHSNKIVGVASGRAEFGPRALGNRSLLADPRGPKIKDTVNEIKRRQKFRPFAPVILEELCNDYFVMPHNWRDSRYMQVVATCRFPELFPAIVHHDGTSRVQTVPNDGSGIRKLLETWYEEFGCPLLLNTSLNIRGEPMVNDRGDADKFEKLYNIKVCS